MAVRFAPDADRRHRGVPLAAQPEVVRFLRDVTVSVFAAGVLCAVFAWLDQTASDGARPVVDVAPVAVEAGGS